MKVNNNTRNLLKMEMICPIILMATVSLHAPVTWQHANGSRGGSLKKAADPEQMTGRRAYFRLDGGAMDPPGQKIGLRQNAKSQHG
jgi:hypothetical protein